MIQGIGVPDVGGFFDPALLDVARREWEQMLTPEKGMVA